MLQKLNSDVNCDVFRLITCKKIYKNLYIVNKILVNFTIEISNRYEIDNSLSQ